MQKYFKFRGKYKMKLLIFIIGFILGGMACIVCMCMVQINRLSEEELRKAETENEKKYNQADTI